MQSITLGCVANEDDIYDLSGYIGIARGELISVCFNSEMVMVEGWLLKGILTLLSRGIG